MSFYAFHVQLGNRRVFFLFSFFLRKNEPHLAHLLNGMCSVLSHQPQQTSEINAFAAINSISRRFGNEKIKKIKNGKYYLDGEQMEKRKRLNEAENENIFYFNSNAI